MLAALIGVFDFPSMLVVAAICAAFAVPAAILLHRPIEKMRIQNDRDKTMADMAWKRDFEFKKLEQNLITSHTRNPSDGDG